MTGCSEESAKITDFLRTKRPKPELEIALSVLLEFKGNESLTEFADISGVAWYKLEQLQEFLEHLCEGKPLADDTIRYMKKVEQLF